MAMGKRMGVVIVLVAHGLAVSCGDRDRIPVSVTAPSPSPGPPGPVPAPTMPADGPVSGGVYDTAHRPLAGALVQALDGSRAGTSTTANAEGAFAFDGAFDGSTQFRASHEGHVASVSLVQIRRPTRGIDFYLAPTAPSAKVAGDYTMVVTADAACTDVPARARSRTYRATIVPNGGSPQTYFDVSVGQAQFLPDFDSTDRFAIAVAGDYLSIWLGDGGTQPGFVESLDGSTYVAFGGKASATVADTRPTIAASFTGFVDYCVMPSALEPPVNGDLYACPDGTALTRVRCESSNHRLIFVPR